MNDNKTNSAEEKSTSFIIPVTIIILLIAAVGYVASKQSGLDEQAFRQALDDWSTQLDESSNNTGRAMRFSYESLTMDGGITDRHAIIVNPRFDTELEEKNELVPVSFSTPLMKVYPTAITLDQAKMHFPKTITVESKGEETTLIESETPLEIFIAQSKVDDHLYTKIESDLPAKSFITLVQDQEHYTVTMDEGARLETRFTKQDKNLGIFNLKAKNILVVEELNPETSVLSLDSITILSHCEPDLEHRYNLKLDAKIANLMTTPEEMPYGAVNGTIDLHYEGPLKQAKDEHIDWMNETAILKLPSLHVKAGDIDISATIDANTTGNGELMPIGSATINIQNVPFLVSELEKNEILAAPDKQLANAILSQAIGQTLDDADVLDLTIARKDGGALTIGKITFEQALAILLTGSAQKAQPTAPTEGEAQGEGSSLPNEAVSEKTVPTNKEPAKTEPQ